jgi:hypothetical protein
MVAGIVIFYRGIHYNTNIECMDCAIVNASCKKTVLYRTENTAIYINPTLLTRTT